MTVEAKDFNAFINTQTVKRVATSPRTVVNKLCGKGLAAEIYATSSRSEEIIIESNNWDEILKPIIMNRSTPELRFQFTAMIQYFSGALEQWSYRSHTLGIKATTKNFIALELQLYSPHWSLIPCNNSAYSACIVLSAHQTKILLDTPSLTIFQ
uniref:Uncharacterized protein n=1 Tax=Glossina pallidipes TaxID=7398 RepID=A0A1A9ZCI5_GLOPL